MEMDKLCSWRCDVTTSFLLVVYVSRLSCVWRSPKATIHVTLLAWRKRCSNASSDLLRRSHRRARRGNAYGNLFRLHHMVTRNICTRARVATSTTAARAEGENSERA